MFMARDRPKIFRLSEVATRLPRGDVLSNDAPRYEHFAPLERRQTRERDQERNYRGTTLCVRTASGPGSPRGQPAWGGGCDRIIHTPWLK
jgi:hypothetical protein